MQNTQQHTTGTVRYQQDSLFEHRYQALELDSSFARIPFKGVNVALCILEGGKFDWVIDDYEITIEILSEISNVYKSTSPEAELNTLDFMSIIGIDTRRFERDIHYIVIECYMTTKSYILWTPTGIKELASVLDKLGCPLGDCLIFNTWACHYRFVGDDEKETIIKKREELIKSNGTGWMFDSAQLANALGIRPDSIRMTKCRHTDKLIEGLHWKYSTRGSRTLLFTKLGCLVMSSLVGTEEAQRTRGFLERAFGITLEEITLTA